MFALRNKGGKDAVSALGEGFGSQSALLKHEIAYVLGQMQDAEAVSTLRSVQKPPRHSISTTHLVTTATVGMYVLLAMPHGIMYVPGQMQDAEAVSTLCLHSHL